MNKEVKSILLTGGSSGIGATAALLLYEAGMTVYAASRSGRYPDGYEGPISDDSQRTASGPAIIPVVLDVNDQKSIEKLIRQIVKEQGSLDAIVCNAGNGIAGSVEDTSVEEIEAQFSTTFYGVVKTIQAAMPQFRAQKKGRIITISSVAALAPLPYQGFYSCVKAGILQLTKVVSIEAKSFGIQTCCIMPGDVRTGFTRARKIAAKAQIQDSPYYEMTKDAIRQMEIDEQKNGMKPEVIGRAVLKQLQKKRMRPEVTPSILYSVLVWALRRCPQRLALKVISKMYS